MRRIRYIHAERIRGGSATYPIAAWTAFVTVPRSMRRGRTNTVGKIGKQNEVAVAKTEMSTTVDSRSAGLRRIVSHA